MNYFHVSLEKNIIKEFIPRIPDEMHRSKNEEVSISRICVTDSIEHCLIAMPDFLSLFDNLNKEKIEMMEYYNDTGYFSYSLKYKKEGVLVIVYVFDKSKDMINNETILKNNYVSDAYKTNESWFIKPIKPADYNYIFITDFSTTNNDVNLKYIDLGKDCKYFIDYSDYKYFGCFEDHYDKKGNIKNLDDYFGELINKGKYIS